MRSGLDNKVNHLLTEKEKSKEYITTKDVKERISPTIKKFETFCEQEFYKYKIN